MKRLLPIAAFAAIVTSGCSSKLTPPDDLKIILPNGSTIWKADGAQPDRLTYDGSATADPSKVAFGVGEFKAYPMGRTPTADGGMREASPYYRQENQPRWWMDAPGQNRVVLGPTVGDKPASLQPAVIEGELAAEVVASRNAIEANNEATARMTGVTKGVAAELRASREENRQKDAYIDKLVADQKAKDAENRRLKAENVKLKDAPQSYQGDSQAK